MKKMLTLVSSLALAAALAAPSFAQNGAAPPPVAAKVTTRAAKAAPTAPTAQEISDAQAKGLVWVNLNTKVFHAAGPYYGKTKAGKFMTRDEAVKAGYKAAQEPVAKKTKATAVQAVAHK